MSTITITITRTGKPMRKDDPIVVAIMATIMRRLVDGCPKP
jgi:hypothetical protein